MKTIPIITASIITGIFIYFTLKPNAFNLIGYNIHEALWSGKANESNFIRAFNITCGIILFWITYKITKKFIT